MQCWCSGLFVVLNSFQLGGCAYNNVWWSPMLLFTSSLVSHKRSSPLVAHFQESCHFLFLFSFFIYRICFPFSQHCFFCWRLIASCLSQTAAAKCCETNTQTKYGWKFLIVKVRLLTLTRTWKWKKKKKRKKKVAPGVFTYVWFQCVESGPYSCALAQYEHASRAREHVNRICLMPFQHSTGVRTCSQKK